jgi:hypothetical protein
MTKARKAFIEGVREDEARREGRLAPALCSTALSPKHINVICSLIEAAKPPYEEGDVEQHKIYCHAIGILVRHWERAAQ